MPTTPRALAVEEALFVDDGSVPNNPRLPLIVYPVRFKPAARPPRSVWRCSRAAVGAAPGATVSMCTITTTALRTNWSG